MSSFLLLFFQSNKTALDTPGQVRHPMLLCFGFFLVRRSFFVGSGSGRVSVPFRRVVGLALSGGCCSWLVRSSSRSFSGCVVWCGFLSRSSAAAFGASASRLVGFAVRVRPGHCDESGFVWLVSVPVVR